MIVAVYKEKEPTSRDVVNKIIKITGEKKTGHAGTLDPLASGVLVVGVGRESTKKLHQKDFDEKEYLATVMLGEESTTDDKEGDKKKWEVKKVPKREELEKIIKCFVGKTKQTPPLYSAVKIKGREAYKYARKGKSVNLSARDIFIKNIKITHYKYPKLKIKIITSKGVYIRSLARDVGKKLNTGGYLYNLERTRVGNYNIEDCVTLSFFENFKKYDNITCKD